MHCVAGYQANLAEVTRTRDALLAEKQNLLTQQLDLTTSVHALQDQLSSAETLKQLYETKISEQQSHVDTLLDQCTQVSMWTCFTDYRTSTIFLCLLFIAFLVKFYKVRRQHR